MVDAGLLLPSFPCVLRLLACSLSDLFSFFPIHWKRCDVDIVDVPFDSSFFLLKNSSTLLNFNHFLSS